MKKKLFKDSSFKQRFLKMLNKEGFYVAIFLGITLVATLVVYYTNNNFEKDLAREDGDVSIESSENLIDTEDVSNVVEEEKEEEIIQPDKTENTNETTTQEETTPSTEPKAEDPLKNLVNPVSSNEVVMAFSMGGAPVYSATLKEFTSDHSGVDIKAEIGQEVKAAAQGKVIKIYKDNKLGQTIIIQHSNNIETRYSNLDEKVAITLNQAVTAGQVIGKVGKTAAFEADDAPHVHFEIWKDSKCVDPSQYLN